MIDYHMHLEQDDHQDKCRYDLERIRLYVDHARKNGIGEIGITEHCNRFVQFRPLMQHLLSKGYDYPDLRTWVQRSFREDLGPYFDALVQAGEEGLPVLASLEVDYIPGQENAIKETLAPYPFDYVLGSVHFLGDWIIDVDPEYGWPEMDVDEVFTRYFETMAQAARSGLFDILAHPDLVKKFGYTPSFPLDELYEALAKAAGESGVAIEISTAGLHKTVGELYPTHQLLCRFREAGVPITFASDAHVPEHIGRDFDKAVAAAHKAGYREFVTFKGRQRRVQPLD